MVPASPVRIHDPEEDAPKGLTGPRVDQGHEEVPGQDREQDIGRGLVEGDEPGGQHRKGAGRSIRERRGDPEDEAGRRGGEEQEAAHQGIQLLPAVETGDLPSRARFVSEPAGEVPEEAPVLPLHPQKGPGGFRQGPPVAQQRHQEGAEEEGHTSHQVEAQTHPAVVAHHEGLEPAEAEEEPAQQEDEGREGDAPVEGPLRGAEPEDDGGRCHLTRIQALALRDDRWRPGRPSPPKRSAALWTRRKPSNARRACQSAPALRGGGWVAILGAADAAPAAG